MICPAQGGAGAADRDQQRAQGRPCLPGGDRYRQLPERGEAEPRGLEGIADARRVRRAHARQELQHAKCRDPVARIVREAQHRKQVLDVRRLEKLEAAILHEGDVAPHQLELEQVAVIRGAKEHRLPAQVHATLARGEHLLDHVTRLRLVVLHYNVGWSRTAVVRASQVLAVLRTRLRHQRVGRIEHGLRRAVVLFERHHARLRIESTRELADILDRRGTERVDRLRVVPHDRDARAVGPERRENSRLEAVRVLVLVDQHVIEARADSRGDVALGHQQLPVEQQVVVVEELLGNLGVDVLATQRRERLLPLEAPGEQ